MKKCFLSVCLILVSFSLPAAEDPEDPKYKRTFSVVFGPGYRSSFQQLLHVGVRMTYSSDKFFSLGGELAYLQRFEPFGNDDYYNAIAFGRMNPWKGVFAEIGLQYYNYLSNPRFKTKGELFPFVSLGYQFRISERKKIELQYRPYNLNDREPFHNASSKVFAAFSYSF